MKIGLDYDGTIAGSDVLKSNHIKEALGIDIPPWKTDRTTCIPELAKHIPLEQAKEFYENFRYTVYTGERAKNAPEVPGALNAIKELAKKHEL
ncbi:hypothetical protein KY312_02445, partial [Candidatus Woesearchaeota archaeon]|nr:hypothetical protein [Candidatus Woesearchaeota archaeon]